MAFREAPKFWLYSHNFTHTGAPLVLSAIAKELAEQGWRRRLRLLSWGGHHDRVHNKLRRELEAEGFHCRVLNPEEAAPKPKPHDRMLLNTLALPQSIIKTALAWLEQGTINRLDWYCHEGNPTQLLPHEHWPQRLLPLLKSGRLQMRVPSTHTLNTYQNWLEYNGEHLAVQIPILSLQNSQGSLFNQPLPIFAGLHLQLTGMAGDGNKGHLWLLRLIQAHENQLTREESNKLRPLYLKFIGLEVDPQAHLAKEIRYLGQLLMGKRFNWTPHTDRNSALEAMKSANIAVSCSRSECFPLVVVEAMALGQPVLRNRSGGWQEQLVPNLTGFDLGETGYVLRKEQIQLLQKLRDQKITTDFHLHSISLESRQHAISLSRDLFSRWLL